MLIRVLRTPLLYAALTTLSALLYAYDGRLNGDFLFGFERFTLGADDPSLAEPLTGEQLVIAGIAMFISSLIAWWVIKPQTWKRYLYCALLNIVLCCLMTGVTYTIFSLSYVAWSAEDPFTFTLLLNAIIAGLFISPIIIMECTGLLILPFLCSCLQGAVIMKSGMWLKKFTC